MISSAQAAKLQQLRDKTDRELSRLVAARLEWGLRRVAEGAPNEETELAYDEAVQWLPLVYRVADTERARLEAQTRELRRLLDEAAVAV